MTRDDSTQKIVDQIAPEHAEHTLALAKIFSTGSSPDGRGLRLSLKARPF